MGPGSASPTQELRYFTGLRGLSCLVVVLAHMVVAFYPALYTGKPAQAHHGWESALANSPAGLLCAGNFMVCIFFVLSAYVLSFGLRGDRIARTSLLSLGIRRYAAWPSPSSPARP